MTAAKITKPFPYLYKDKDRQGAVRWILRAPGRKAVTVKGTYGTPDFAAAYRAALEGNATVAPVVIATRQGTMAALARTYLCSAAFSELSASTQRARRHLIETYIIGKWGKFPVAGLEQKHVREKMIDPLAGKPGTARNLLSALRVLLARAVQDGLRADDPTAGIKRPKLSKAGWHAWTEAEIAQFEAHHPIGSPARLAFALALYTGQRSADLIRMGRQHLADGRIAVRQQKTGTSLLVPVHPKLRAIMDATRSEHLTFLVSEIGKPYATASSFGHRMRKWAEEAGLTDCPLHGLRKACCRRLAEAGCTAPEIMSISGHKSLAEVERYIKDAAQVTMADRAIART